MIFSNEYFSEEEEELYDDDDDENDEISKHLPKYEIFLTVVFYNLKVV